MDPWDDRDIDSLENLVCDLRFKFYNNELAAINSIVYGPRFLITPTKERSHKPYSDRLRENSVYADYINSFPKAMDRDSLLAAMDSSANSIEASIEQVSILFSHLILPLFKEKYGNESHQMANNFKVLRGEATGYLWVVDGKVVELILRNDKNGIAEDYLNRFSKQSKTGFSNLVPIGELRYVSMDYEKLECEKITNIIKVGNEILDSIQTSNDTEMKNKRLKQLREKAF